MSTREPCPSCGGSGQISYFKGVSRFLLTCEECPECAGLGLRLDPEAGEGPQNRRKRTGKTRQMKKNPKEKKP